MSRNTLHSYHKTENSYQFFGVYIVRCYSKKGKQGHINIPVLAPLPNELAKLNLPYEFEINEPGRKYTFDINAYIKACAITIAEQIDLDTHDSSAWKPDSYEYCEIVACCGSIDECINDDTMLDRIDSQVIKCFSFHEMMSHFYHHQRTTCVHLKELKRGAL